MSAPPRTALDPGQAIVGAFDDATGAFRVNAAITVDAVALSIDDADDSIKIGNGSGVYSTITNTGGKNALDVNIAGGTVSVGTVTSNIHDSAGNTLNSTSNALNVSVQNSSIPVTGTFFQATQPVSGSVSVSNFPATQPISGTVTANAGTGTFTVDASGHTVPISAVSLPLPTGASTSALQTTGNTSIASINTKTPALGQALAASSVPIVLTAAQLTTLTPLTAVTANAGTNLNTSALALDATLTAGTQQTKITDGTNIASVKAASSAAIATDNAVVVAVSPNNTVGVTGTFFQATQPISASSLPLPAGASTSALQTTGNTSVASIDTKTPSLGQAAAINSVPVVLPTIQITALTPPTTVTVTQATASNLNANVSGTVTSNIGTTNGLALDATLTGGTQQSKITDGTNVASVKAASTAAVATDKALVVAISPNNSVAVTGTFFQATQPISGTVTVTQATGTNLHTVIDSGTITANIGTTNGLALDTSVNGVLVAQASTTSGEKGPLVQGAVTTGAPTYTTAQTNPLSLNTSGGLRVDGSGSTQPISAASLPLPTGASTAAGLTTINTTLGSPFQAGASIGNTSFSATQATAANLNATVVGTITANAGTGNFTVTQSSAASLNATIIGTGSAGTPSAGVVTVQGNASGTPIPVSGTVTASNPSVSATAATPPASATYVGGSVTTAAPTYTNAQMNALSLNTSGGLRIDGSGVTQPISAASLPLPTGASTAAGLTTINTTLGSPFQAGASISNTSFIATQATAANLNATITGTVTANAGTNLNTSALALDSTLTGGTQQNKITDGTNITSVKAASTAAIATDKALVVAISPNNSVAVTGTFFQTTQPVSGSVTANIGTTNGLALDATLTGGTQKTKLVDTAGTNVATIKAASTGAIATDTALVVAISPNNLLTVNAIPQDGSKATYSASAAVTTAATATDFFTITGSATKAVRVTLIRISGIATTAATPSIFVIRRSAANTGGTSTAQTAVTHDTGNNPAATATVLAYTVNPSGLGAAVGTIRQDRVSFLVTGTAAQPTVEMDFGTRPSQAVVLRGIAQVLAVNLGGVTVAGGSINIDLEWSEE